LSCTVIQGYIPCCQFHPPIVEPPTSAPLHPRSLKFSASQSFSPFLEPPRVLLLPFLILSPFTPMERVERFIFCSFCYFQMDPCSGMRCSRTIDFRTFSFLVGRLLSYPDLQEVIMLPRWRLSHNQYKKLIPSHYRRVSPFRKFPFGLSGLSPFFHDFHSLSA